MQNSLDQKGRGEGRREEGERAENRMNIGNKQGRVSERASGRE